MRPFSWTRCRSSPSGPGPRRGGTARRTRALGAETDTPGSVPVLQGHRCRSKLRTGQRFPVLLLFPLSRTIFSPLKQTNQRKNFCAMLASLALGTTGQVSGVEGAGGTRGRRASPATPRPPARAPSARRAQGRARGDRTGAAAGATAGGPSCARAARAAAASRRRSRPARLLGPGVAPPGRRPRAPTASLRSPGVRAPCPAPRALPPQLSLRLLLAEVTSKASSLNCLPFFLSRALSLPPSSLPPYSSRICFFPKSPAWELAASS